MLSQADRNPSQNRCAQYAARQRRIRFRVSALAGALLSLGALTTLQAASQSSGHLPLKTSAHGTGSRLLSGVGTVDFAADALPYAVLAGLPRPGAEQASASAVVAESSSAVVEVPAATTEAALDAQAAGEEAVLAAIEQWAKAWRSKDVAAYLAAYGEGFQPANGVSRDDWAKQRQQRIADKRVIQLELRDIEIQSEAADRVRVSFVQDYRADQFVERGTAKLLVLALEKGGWRILAEESAR
ncbi:MAG: nuclear transport factor 2 family protein [Dechloromonas sp.]|nr:nuclear transport factor 2 family protein [Dechloromonas sp.]